MADQTTNEEANREALNGLPDKDKAETQKILDEIAAEAGTESDRKPEEKAAEDAKAEEARRAALTDEEKAAEDAAKAANADGKPDLEKKPDGEKPKPEGRRNAPKLMPVYVHKVAEKKWESEKATLISQIEDLSKLDNTSTETEESKAKFEAEVKRVAETHGYAEEFVRDVLKLMKDRNGEIPEAVREAIQTTHFMKTERGLETEEAHYGADFDRIIVPLIKREYGDDVSPTVISDIKEDLKGMAYSEEYAKVPYEVIYNGNSQFRGLAPQKQRGAEGSRGGTQASVGDLEKPDLSKPLSDDIVRGLSDADFETYSKNMETFERSSRQR